MSASSAIRAGAAYVEVFMEQNALSRSLAATSAKLRAWSAGLGRLGAATRGGGLPEPLAAIAHFSFSPAGLVAGMLEAVREWAKGGAELAHLSEQAGTTVEEFSALSYAARRCGVDTGGLAIGIRKMQVTIAAAGRGMKQANDVLASLGANLQELSGMKPEEQFKNLAERITAIQNPTERTAATVRIFGRAGTELLPLLNQGSSGIEQFTQRARELGLVTSNETAQSALRFSRLLADLQDVFKRCVFIIGGALAPNLEDLVGKITTVAVRVRQWISENRGLITTAFKLAGAVVAAGVGFSILGRMLGLAVVPISMVLGGLKLVGSAVAMIGTVASAGFSLFSTALGIAGSAISFLLSPIGLVVAAVVGLGVYFLYTSGTIGKAINMLGGVFDILKSDALTAFGGIRDALASGDIALAAKVLWSLLKLEWQRGINWVKNLWSGFKWYFLSVWNEAVISLSTTITEAWSGLKRAWVNVVSFMKSIWTGFSTEAGNIWNRAQDTIGSAFINALSATGVISKDEGALAKQMLSQDMDTKIKERSSAGNGKNAQIESDRQKDLQRIEQERRDMLKSLESDKDADQTERTKEYEAEVEARQAEVEAARRELDALRVEVAGKKAQEVASKGKGEGDAFSDMNLGNLPGAKATVVGTFSAAAVSGMGLGGGVFQEMKQQLNRIGDNGERLLQEVQMGGTWD
jgi:hypothetical protein